MSRLKLALAVMVLATPSASAFAGTEVLNTKFGGESVNNVRVEVKNDANIDIDNDADLHNDVEVDANTGSNEVEDNEGDVELATGDADVKVGVKNVANVTEIGKTCKDKCKEEDKDNEKEDEDEDDKVLPGPSDEEEAGGGVAAAAGELALASGGEVAENLEGFGGGPLAEAGPGLALLFGAPAVGTIIKRIRDLVQNR